MKTFLLPLSLSLLCTGLDAQGPAARLARAVQALESLPEMKHALVGVEVFDNRKGEIIYQHNAQTGMAPGSTQKIFTSMAALELLGKDFRYSTGFYLKRDSGRPSSGQLLVKAQGDPSFGSFRYPGSRPLDILKAIMAGLKTTGIRQVDPDPLVLTDSAFSRLSVPGGWIWEDIGNYYGAPARGFNWRENQYDLVLGSGKKTGDPAAIRKTIPGTARQIMGERLSTGEKGSGDNTIVYPALDDSPAYIEGTIPPGEDSFLVSGSLLDPAAQFKRELDSSLASENILVEKISDSNATAGSDPSPGKEFPEVYRHQSPILDSLNYWFLQKSINLYGEAFLHTLAGRFQAGSRSLSATEFLQDFWKRHGVEPAALHIEDGCGLSPQNRVTPDALVRALEFGRSRPWFPQFLAALPLHNGLSMKSGSIGGARAFAGYSRGTDGNSYSFAIIVNNFDGPAARVIQEMYSVLNNLK
jgi:serine-type D-Ala-D-Ala carboxypeptidase/endopeptidase (penicillin-binding protein 4)